MVRAARSPGIAATKLQQVDRVAPAWPGRQRDRNPRVATRTLTARADRERPRNLRSLAAQGEVIRCPRRARFQVARRPRALPLVPAQETPTVAAP